MLVLDWFFIIAGMLVLVRQSKITSNDVGVQQFRRSASEFLIADNFLYARCDYRKAFALFVFLPRGAADIKEDAQAANRHRTHLCDIGNGQLPLVAERFGFV